MSRVNIFNVKKFRNNSKEKAKGKENKKKIVTLFHCFIVGNFISDNQKYQKRDPEKTPEEKKHPKRGNLTVAGFKNKWSDLTDTGQKFRGTVDSNTADKRFEKPGKWQGKNDK